MNHPGTHLSRWIFIFVLAVLFLGQMKQGLAQGQTGAIAGNVSDSTGGVLKGAQVSLESKNISVVSNEQGLFLITDLAPGNYALTISYVGFTTFKKSLDVAAGKTINMDAGQGKVPVEDAPTQTSPVQTVKGPHKFWDAENLGLFVGVAVTRALDFTSTQHFRERGHNEILLSNQIVDNKPLFAGIEAAGTAASIGLAYWLHHTGHHRAERWVSLVHIGVGATGDIHNYGLSRPQLTGTVH